MGKVKLDYVISGGHGLKVQGANGIVNEYVEAKKIAKKTHDILQSDYLGNGRLYLEKTATTQNGNLDNIIGYHNKFNAKLNISVHLNAGGSTATGAETFEYKKTLLGDKMSKAMADALDIKDRGAKDKNTRNLAFTRETTNKSILLECFFVTSKKDTDSYKKNFNELCEAIAKVIADYCGMKKYTKKPTNDTYTVVKGDNLYKIATKHGMSLEKLLKLNKSIKPEYVLQIGTVLKVK